MITSKTLLLELGVVAFERWFGGGENIGGTDKKKMKKKGFVWIQGINPK